MEVKSLVTRLFFIPPHPAFKDVAAKERKLYMVEFSDFILSVFQKRQQGAHGEISGYAKAFF